MRAVVYDSYTTDNTDLRIAEVPEPKVGPGQVLIEVRAAGVNPVDWKIMAGSLDPMMDAMFPVIPGWDVAGVVCGLGPDTPEFDIGDEVMAYARKDVVSAGTFAEYVAVPAASVAKKPATLDWPQAAGLPLAGMTAQRSLDRLNVDDRDVLLVHGAAGGVGTFAVRLGRDRGARVVGTASVTNHDFLRELGAEPVSYGDGLIDRVRQLAPAGVTAVADLVGGQLDTTLAVLAPNARHISIADSTVTDHGGDWIWVRPDGQKLSELASAVARGGITVTVSQTFGLDEVAAAFDASYSGHTRGKLVVVL